MTALAELIHNKALIVPVACWGIAQFIKVLIYSIQNGKVELYHIFEDGGMPSAHSATVTSLATSCAMLYGLGSAEFAMTTLLAIIVMHDAMGVRLESGKQAAVINEIVRMLDGDIKHLKELIGHTPVQVISGALLGLLVTLLIG